MSACGQGLILLDKPLGLSSTQALSRVKRLAGVRKAGHTGALDPLASGMLPLCFGPATRVAGALLHGSKRYLAELQLGIATSTGDAEGEIIARAAVPELAQLDLASIAGAWVGASEQIPPMTSALKRDGVPLYKLARRGQTVDRPARRIVISALELTIAAADRMRIDVVCSGGTYVRVLAEDLARAIGSCGHLTMLRRLWVSPFDQAQMITLDELAALPTPHWPWLDADLALIAWPMLELEGPQVQRLRCGQRLVVGDSAPLGKLRVYGPAREFVGLAEAIDGVLHPRQIWPVTS